MCGHEQGSKYAYVLVPLLAGLFLTAALILAISLAAGGETQAQAYSPLVLAEYQAWHGLPPHTLAPYTSTDPIVIASQIQAAKALGIGGFVVDWYGPPAGVANDADRVFIDQATAELLRQAEGQDFAVALLYDEGTVSATETITADLIYARRYLTMPAYLQVNGRSALFVFPYPDVDPLIDWASLREVLGITVTLLDEDPNPDDPAHDGQFDGFYAWVQATNGQWQADGSEWGEAYLHWFYQTMAGPAYASKVTVGGVWPGFDDSSASWGLGRFISRRCGQTWQDTWRLAEQYQSLIVMIATWNDFEEGTAVEYGLGACFYLPVMLRTPF